MEEICHYMHVRVQCSKGILYYQVSTSVNSLHVQYCGYWFLEWYWTMFLATCRRVVTTNLRGAALDHYQKAFAGKSFEIELMQTSHMYICGMVD